ncbi:CG13720 [Drosophila busckii]|uniref:CG13720 n=1 Tax=Drosophila busckii TaxID=30019 RepID=A0A0M4EJU8_DROBS|nr:uncharacterized protein LOC108597998 [Drosophila busckii]ALC43360.1 CG13720 [Drosophila busckii]
MATYKLLLSLALLQLTLGIRVENEPTTAANSSNSYRISRPEPKQPIKRVPPHLQDVRPGYVDDDAGDVIRIIEPPPHFQQLKRQRQRQQSGAPQMAVVWEQPRKLSINRPSQSQPTPTAAAAQRVKRPATGAGDLLTQEAQLNPHITNSLQLPVEILASVRKTERLLQRQRQQLPLVRQRHIQRQTHTLIAQKSLEQQRYQRMQQQRLRALLSQEHKRSKRVKRELRSDYGVAEGLKLVAHLGELLQNATRLLPDEQAPTTTETTTTTTQATKCDRRRRCASQKTTPKRRGRYFRHEATTAAAATNLSTTTTSATPLASRLVNSRKSPNSNTNNRNQLTLAQLPSYRSDDAILYADVMSNIRNLWQEHVSSASQFNGQQQPVQHNDTTDYRALHVYLHELDEISKKLPTVAPIIKLNQEEFMRATPTSSWYLINNEGEIYETQNTPKTQLFHRFPDINASASTQDLN